MHRLAARDAGYRSVKLIVSVEEQVRARTERREAQGPASAILDRDTRKL